MGSLVFAAKCSLERKSHMHHMLRLITIDFALPKGLQDLVPV